jgi:DNA-binding response OmpR family regulator
MAEILIVDDDDELREGMMQVLRDHGFSVRGARDGAEALELLQSRTPALIVMDVMMPKLDGWGLRQAMSLRPELAGVPIIVISALEPRGNLLEVLRPAAALRKPFCLTRLLKHIRDTLDEVPRPNESRRALR